VVKGLVKAGLAKRVMTVFVRLAKELKGEAQVTRDGKGAEGKERTVVFPAEVFVEGKSISYKPGTFDAKLRYDSSYGRELKALVSNQSITRNAISLATSSSYVSLRLMAIAEGSKVTVVDVSGFLLDEASSGGGVLDKGSVRTLSKNAVPYEVVSVAFNPANSKYLAVWGLRDIQVFSVSPSGTVLDRLQVEVGADGYGDSVHILQALWLPNSQVNFMVVTNRFLKIFDLSTDNMCPTFNYTLTEDSIRQVSMGINGRGVVTLYVLSGAGHVFIQELHGSGVEGPCYLTDTVQVPEHMRGKNGISLHFSQSAQLLFICYDDARCCAGRVIKTGTPSEHSLKDAIALPVEPKTDPGSPTRARVHPLASFVDAAGCTGDAPMVVASSRKGNTAVAYRVTGASIQAQVLSISPLASTANRVEGLCSSLTSAVFLLEDGSLHSYPLPSPPTPTAASIRPPPPPPPSRRPKSISPPIAPTATATTSSASSVGPNNQTFPVDFFEHTHAITSDVTFSGEAASDFAKQQKAAAAANVAEGFLDSVNNGQSATDSAAGAAIHEGSNPAAATG